MNERFAVAAAVALAEAVADALAAAPAAAPSCATSDADSVGTSPASEGKPRRELDKAPSFAEQKQGMVDALPNDGGRVGEIRSDVMASGARYAQGVPPPRRCTILSARTAQRRAPGGGVNVVTLGPRTTKPSAHHRPRPCGRRDRVDPEDRAS